MSTIQIAIDAAISGVAVFCIWYTMQPGEIFGRLGDWFEKHLPEKLTDPVYECPVCMFPYYGIPFYILVLSLDRIHDITVREMILVLFFGIGFNAIVNSAVSYFRANKRDDDDERNYWL